MTDTEGMTRIDMMIDREEMINQTKRAQSGVTSVNLWVIREMLWLYVCTKYYRKHISESAERKSYSKNINKRNLTPGPDRQDKFNYVDDSCNLKELQEQ